MISLPTKTANKKHWIRVSRKHLQVFSFFAEGFLFFFFNVLKKLMLLVSDAVLYQSAVPGKPSTCALQKKGDRYVAFLISPFILRLQCAVLRNV